MADVDIIRDRTGELMVAEISGGTEAGEEFVDAWVSPEMVVVDAGRVIVPEDELERVRREAAESGLSVDEYEGGAPDGP